MTRLLLFGLGLAGVVALPVFAQHAVPPRHMYERVYMVVPMIGAGTWADPKRPLFAPAPGQIKPGDRSGIIAFQHQISDDGKSALVEFVAANKTALAPLLARATAAKATQGVQLFQRETHTQAQIETAFKAAKKDFDFNRFEVRVP